MKECIVFETLINWFLDGEITPKEQKELEKHLAECEHCRKYLEETQKIKEKLADLELEAPTALVSNVMSEVKNEQRAKKHTISLRYLAAAAAAVIVIISAIAILPGLKTSKVSDNAKYRTDSMRSFAGYSTVDSITSITAGVGGTDEGESAETESVMMTLYDAPKSFEEPETVADDSSNENRNSVKAEKEEQMSVATTYTVSSAYSDSVSLISSPEIPVINGRTFKLYVFTAEIGENMLPDNAEEIESDEGRKCYILDVEEGRKYGENDVNAEMLFYEGKEDMAVIVIDY